MRRVRLGQIRAANRTAYNKVAADDHLLVGQVINHVPRGVTGRVEHSHFDVADGKLLIVCKETIRLEWFDPERQAEQTGLQLRVAHHRGVGGMEQERGPRETLLYDWMIGEMIKMPVRQPQTDDIQPLLRRVFEQRPQRVIGRIKDDALAGHLVSE